MSNDILSAKKYGSELIYKISPGAGRKFFLKKSGKR
jgi:hypothetical protein